VSSATVRAAIVAYLGSVPIAGLNKIHPAPPYWADGSEWDLKKQLGSGAIAAVHLVTDNESRITVPVNTGQKKVEYTVGLMLFYQWLMPATLTPQDESAWAGPLDVIIDGVKALLRADPNCGLPATVWESAQQPGDVTIVRDIPRRLPGKVLSWNVLEWHVTEIITA
jgi:hypothetical protein